MNPIRRFFDRGLGYPLGIALGLGTVLVWNAFFLYKAIQTAPEVDPAYTHAIER